MTWKYPGSKLELNEELAYLIEALKVEGWWSTKGLQASIQNKNLPLLAKVEQILKNYKVSFSKRVLIKIKLLDSAISKDDIKILSDYELVSFHLERSPFDGSKKIVFFLHFQPKYEVFMILKKRKYKITINFGDEEINVRTIYPAFGYLEIRFYGAQFIRFIDSNSFGKGSHKIRVNRNISDYPKFLASAFSAVIDCEGSLDFYHHYRRIRVRMFNQEYLHDWKRLLYKFGISANVNSEGLVITGLEDFKKLVDLGITLFHSKKRVKFDLILNSYKREQIARGSAIDFYSKKLKDCKSPVTALDFSRITGKSKSVINHHLLRMSKLGLLNINKGNVKWVYSVKYQA